MNWKSIALLACVAGCGGGSSKYMVKTEEHAVIAAPAGKALVVFCRPSRYGKANTPTILDGAGNYVGQSPARGWIRYAVSPGTHRFIIWAENTAPMVGEFSAGKVYYVDVGIRMGGWSARAHLLPVKRGSSDWDKVGEWTQHPEWVATDEMRSKWNAKFSDRVQKQNERADTAWEKYDDEDREQRTMGPNDGR